jgi:hypothetical protein
MPTLRNAAAAFLLFLPLIAGGSAPMNVTQHEWVQREWTRAGAPLYERAGDFHELSGLLPDRRGDLQRGPGWSSIVTIAGFTDISAMYYDGLYNRYVMIGKNASNHLAAAYYSSIWTPSAVTELTSATSNAGGVQGFRALLFNGNSYLIGANKRVYKGAYYSYAHSEFYATADAWMLVRASAELFMVTNAGAVFKLNDAQDAFESYATPEEYLIPLAAYPYRGYLCILAQLQTGGIGIYRVSIPTHNAFHEITRVYAPIDTLAYNAAISVLHDDTIYFSPGPRETPDGTYTVDVYAFNGSQVEKVAQIPDAAPYSQAQGLLSWNGELVYWSLFQTTAKFLVLAGDAFTEFAPSSAMNASGFNALAGVLAGDLVVTGKNPAGTHGLYHAGADTFQDGYMVTSRLDMGHPGTQKVLHRLTVLLDEAVEDFNVVIKYRVNDATTWTTATTKSETKRVTVDDLGVSFYTLEVRVDLDDDTGAGDQDVRILALSAVYSEGY